MSSATEAHPWPELRRIGEEGDERALGSWALGILRSLLPDPPRLCAAVACGAAESVLEVWERSMPESRHLHRRVEAIRAWLAEPSDANRSALFGLRHGHRPPLGGPPLTPVVEGVPLDPPARAAYWACDDALTAAALAPVPTAAFMEPAAARPTCDAVLGAVEAHVRAGTPRKEAVRRVVTAMLRAIEAHGPPPPPPPKAPAETGPWIRFDAPCPNLFARELEEALPAIAAALDREVPTSAGPAEIHEDPRSGERTEKHVYGAPGLRVELFRQTVYNYGVDHDFRLTIALDSPDVSVVLDTQLPPWGARASGTEANAVLARLRPALEQLVRAPRRDR